MLTPTRQTLLIDVCGDVERSCAAATFGACYSPVFSDDPAGRSARGRFRPQPQV